VFYKNTQVGNYFADIIVRTGYCELKSEESLVEEHEVSTLIS